MSRDGSGVYSLPAGSTVTNGDVSDSSDINTPLADLEADANVARPIVAGGTGATTAAAARANILESSYSLNTITYLTSGTAATYTTPSGARALRVTGVGGGGGGGGVDGEAGGAAACSSGGSGGGGFQLWITSPEASYTYTIGAGGAGGAAGANDGADGGDTTWAGASNTATAGGGGGGVGHLGTTGTSGGVAVPGGAFSVSGFSNYMGAGGQISDRARVSGGNVVTMPSSGGSAFGFSGGVSVATTALDNTVGYGGGGGGVYIGSTDENRAGGDGGDGIIIVEVFF